jgi:uncharacterized protein (TIGR02270 family)
MHSDKVISSIISQHAEEAAFLWLSRKMAIAAPHPSLKQLVELDERLEAHLDGLRIAGGPAWEICEEQLAPTGAGEIFAAAALAFETEDNQRLTDLLKAASKSVQLSRGLISALGWLPGDRAQPHIRRLSQSQEPMGRRMAIAAAAVLRRDPGPALVEALRDNDSLLKARALRAVGELGRLDLIPVAKSGLPSDKEDVRFAAALSVALLSGDSQAVGVLQSLGESKSIYRERAGQMALRRMELSGAKAWQKRLNQSPAHLRLAVMGAGAIGDPEYGPWLVERMKVPALARVAGEAFTMITGADFDSEHLDGTQPDGFKAGPTENPEDENVAMDPDDNLPWPEPALVQKWWDKNRGQFQNGTRYILGKPMTSEWLKTVLRDGRQRQRAAAALELAIREPGTPLFNVKAPGFRQIQLLGKPGPPIR